ncbi:MAG TPA: hypothetical protein VMV56_10255 [Williamwhitmania sp.]|nr:hypothetical protein [Williamwhitmania sp.]
MEKDELNVKKLIIIALSLSLILNLGFALYFFQFLSKSSEFASALLSLSAKIEIVFISLLLSGIYTLIIYLLFFKFKDIIIVIVVLALIPTMFLNYSINSSIACPDSLASNGNMRNIRKVIKENKKNTEGIFKSAELFMPDVKTVSQDKNKIVQGIRKLLSFDTQSSELNKIIDSTKISQINELFGMNYSDPNKLTFKTISNSLECIFTCYSPNYKHFIAILTYEEDHTPLQLDYYNGLVLFCEKKNKKIFVYSYTHPVSQWNKYTKDAFFYEVISSHFYCMGDYTLDGYGFKGHLHPFKKLFWQSKYFFDTIKINNEYYFRYQTTLKYNNLSSKNEYAKRGVYIIE